jgi:iron complex outermembrane receptor protein
LRDVYDTRAGLNTPEQDIEAYGGAFNAEFAISDTLKVRNILGYRKDRSETPIDFDALPAADVDVPAIYANEQISNELQLLYEGDRFQGLLGAYVLDAESENIFDVVLATTRPPRCRG